MPVPPFPVIPAPRTWSPGGPVLEPYLRGDLGNAALLLANKPMFIGAAASTGQSLPGGSWTPVSLDTEYLDAYGGHNEATASASWTAPNPSSGPLSGWYLIEGHTEAQAVASNQNFAVGLRAVQNGTTTDAYCGMGIGNGSNDQAMNGAILTQLDATKGDRVSMLANPDATCPVVAATFTAEWVAASSGTVVSSPPTPAVWPDGAGTVITNAGGIPAGSTTILVGSNAGMVAGGRLGLDYLHGQAVSSYAETVTITSVTGSVIGITATANPHGGSYSPGNVAVPVSAAFLNSQVRDMINFLAYPPIAHLYVESGSGESIPDQTWPAGTEIPFTGQMIDNFGGWFGSGHSGWKAPVGGVYYVYGQVAAYAQSQYTLAAGLAVNSGTIQWGGNQRNPNAATNLPLTATVRRHMRLNAGDVLRLYGNQNSGSSLNIQGGYQQCSRLIVVFRSF